MLKTQYSLHLYFYFVTVLQVRNMINIVQEDWDHFFFFKDDVVVQPSLSAYSVCDILQLCRKRLGAARSSC